MPFVPKKWICLLLICLLCSLSCHSYLFGHQRCIKQLSSNTVLKDSKDSSRSPYLAQENLLKVLSSFLVLLNTFTFINPPQSLAIENQQSVGQSSFDPSLEVRVVPPPPKSKRPLAYSVEMGDPQYLQPRTAKGEESLIKRLVNSKVLLFGDHATSSIDKQLEISLLDRMIKINPKRTIVLGSQSLPQSEAIDRSLIEFVKSKRISSDQKEAIDKFLAAVEAEVKAEKLSEKRLEEVRSSLPLFLWARDHSIRIVPLDLPFDTQQNLRKEGLPALTDELRASYLIDPLGFIAAVQNPAYITYTKDILKYQFQSEYPESSEFTGLQSQQKESSGERKGDVDQKEKEYKKAFENYVSAKMFEHEAIATRILAALLTQRSADTVSSPSAIDNRDLYNLLPATLPATEREDKTTKIRPSETPTVESDTSDLPLVVAILHDEDTIFHYGVEERVKRIKTLFINPQDRPKYFYEKLNKLLAAQAESEREGGPTIEISDEIRVTGKVAPNEDVYSILLNPSAADSRSNIPALRLGLAFVDDFVNDRTLNDFLWFSDYPSVKLLTRPQNPISKEGHKPAGETSILGVF